MSKSKENIAELCGIILGDGHLHKTSNSITIVGSLEDLTYFKSRVIPLFQQFGVSPALRRRNDRKAYYLQLENKEFFSLLIKKFGLTRGNKRFASVPNFIKEDIKLIPEFLRGIFDTDGCLKFSKQGSKKNWYPRIQLQFQKSQMAMEIEDLLLKAKYTFGRWLDKRGSGVIYYQISGEDSAERWFSEIKPINPVQTSKFHFWKKFGYYMPRSSLNDRMNALHLNNNE